jgi:hypothetical protein
MLQAGRSRVPFPIRSLDISINLILPGAAIVGIATGYGLDERSEF